MPVEAREDILCYLAIASLVLFLQYEKENVIFGHSTLSEARPQLSQPAGVLHVYDTSRILDCRTRSNDTNFKLQIL